MSRQDRPRVFIDADVVFAGSFSSSEQGASLVILRMAEITLIEAVTSEQVVAEAERNLEKKLPRALPSFRLLVDRCLQVVPDPHPEIVSAHRGAAHPKDLPILVAAAREKCGWLVTFNVAHFKPGLPGIVILSPGSFVQTVRDQLTGLSSSGR